MGVMVTVLLPALGFPLISSAFSLSASFPYNMSRERFSTCVSPAPPLAPFMVLQPFFLCQIHTFCVLPPRAILRLVPSFSPHPLFSPFWG